MLTYYLHMSLLLSHTVYVHILCISFIPIFKSFPEFWNISLGKLASLYKDDSQISSPALTFPLNFKLTYKNSPLTTSDIAKSSGHLKVNGAKVTTDCSPPPLPWWTSPSHMFPSHKMTPKWAQSLRSIMQGHSEFLSLHFPTSSYWQSFPIMSYKPAHLSPCACQNSSLGTNISSLDCSNYFLTSTLLNTTRVLLTPHMTQKCQSSHLNWDLNFFAWHLKPCLPLYLLPFFSIMLANV